MIFKKLLLLIFTFIYINANEAFVPPSYLKESLDNDNLILIDVGAKNLYNISHIDGAIHVNVSDFLDIFSPYMLMKSADDIQDEIIKLGINDNSEVIIYSRNTDKSLLDSSYIALILITHGFDNVSILDGGYMAWVFENALLTSSMEFESEIDGNATLSFNNKITVDFDYVKDNISKVKLLDSRSPDEYYGIDRSTNTNEVGHIPNASSSYYKDKFLTDGTIRDIDELQEMFLNGYDLNASNEVIIYGDNVFSASMNWYILYNHLNFKNAKIYEASLLEWGNYDLLPMTRFKWE